MYMYIIYTHIYIHTHTHTHTQIYIYIYISAGSTSLILVESLLVILIDYMIFLSPFLDVIRMSISKISFLALLNSGILKQNHQKPFICRFFQNRFLVCF